MSVPLAEEYKSKSKETLINIIEKPKWKGTDMEEQDASDTLIPDLISVPQIDGVDYFLIFDAKYYNIQLEKGKSLRGNPGVSDVTKQYLYQLAYRHFISINSNRVPLPCDSGTNQQYLWSKHQCRRCLEHDAASWGANR